MKSLLQEKMESRDWHYDPSIPSTDAYYAGRIENLECSELLEHLDWGEVRYHVDKEDDDEHLLESLDRTKADFISFGYQQHNTRFQKIYDEDAHPYFCRIRDLAKLDGSNLNLIKQSPGQCLPWHFDTFKRQADLRGLKGTDRKQLKRYLVFLEDWDWGHMVQVGNSVLTHWLAGDVYTWDFGRYHLSCNAGLRPKYTMHITGMPTDASLHSRGDYSFYLNDQEQ
jgi:hypothetical protein